MRPVDYALKEYGTREVPGQADNPRIMEYARDIGATWVTSDEIPWCAVFVQWCLKQANDNYSYMADALYFENYGLPTAAPEVGAIALFQNTTPGKAYCHVAFYVANDEHGIYVLGGNQGNQVNIIQLPYADLVCYRNIGIQKAPDDPSFRYNTSTGKLNPKYKGNA